MKTVGNGSPRNGLGCCGEGGIGQLECPSHNSLRRRGHLGRTEERKTSSFLLHEATVACPWCMWGNTSQRMTSLQLREISYIFPPLLSHFLFIYVAGQLPFELWFTSKQHNMWPECLMFMSVSDPFQVYPWSTFKNNSTDQNTVH